MIKRYIYNKPQQFLGVLLFAFYFSQLASDNIWQLLVVLQRIDLYKQLSGFMILLYVAGQWRLAYLRLSTGASRAAKHLVVHKWLGVLAPILLCLHTVEKGYAYQTLLLVLFIVISITGLLNFYDVKLKKRWFVLSWTVMHVALAVMIPLLVIQHIYITYSYN